MKATLRIRHVQTLKSKLMWVIICMLAFSVGIVFSRDLTLSRSRSVRTSYGKGQLSSVPLQTLKTHEGLLVQIPVPLIKDQIVTLETPFKQDFSIKNTSKSPLLVTIHPEKVSNSEASMNGLYFSFTQGQNVVFGTSALKEFLYNAPPEGIQLGTFKPQENKTLTLILSTKSDDKNKPGPKTRLNFDAAVTGIQPTPSPRIASKNSISSSGSNANKSCAATATRQSNFVRLVAKFRHRQSKCN